MIFEVILINVKKFIVFDDFLLNKCQKKLYY